MEFLQNILDGSNFPILSAFILGLMTAISPCPLATNITAIAYIGKNIENKRKVFINGLLYTLGRAFSYVVLGVVLFFGASKFHVASFFQGNGEKILGPLLVVIGILMLDIIKIKFPGLGNITDRFQNSEKHGSGISAFLMGIVFALAFCPYSGVLYFGMLIPMSIASPSGLILPLVFAIATGFPVIIFAYLIAFTLSGVGKLYNSLKIFELWFRRVVAAIFILVGFYYIYIFYL
ncbi:MAG TPA: cytochrome C biogenesis protein [Saprospirales bacterium]|nr:cytochrome C biogenesis protein [Saprospirales bacterium]HAY71891.1 cytochrome C biogenesis protein [Saprospirales bacterium]HRQ28580.1 aromatic aminobenezylarsenical efflux permease ArsG family transporter [Saprospiraceae bacterium]